MTAKIKTKKNIKVVVTSTIMHVFTRMNVLTRSYTYLNVDLLRVLRLIRVEVRTKPRYLCVNIRLTT